MIDDFSSGWRGASSRSGASTFGFQVVYKFFVIELFFSLFRYKVSITYIIIDT